MMAPACRLNVDNMNREAQARDGLSVLSLEFQADEARLDWPVVGIKVDGLDPFVEVAKDWRGFDPAKMLGSASPLLPGDLGRRVALYTCSCGEAGCGVIAPFVVSSPDGRRISWVDFRDYVGVFVGPLVEDSDKYEGKPWRLTDLHFDREQYEAEVARASADKSWETSRRKTARLVKELLDDMCLELPPNLSLRWVAPAWNADGVELSFEHVSRTHEFRLDQQLLRLTSSHDDPDLAANDMVDQLVGTDPADRFRAFGHQR